MAMTLIEYERELSEAKAKLEEVQTKRKIILQQEQDLSTVVAGWEAIIAVARKKADGTQLELPGTITYPEHNESHAVGGDGNDDEEEEGGTNKTQFVRDHIQGRGGLGTTPDDLKKAAMAIGMLHPPSWPYGPLQRLKKKGDIIKRRGKFYPKEGTNQSLALVG